MVFEAEKKKMNVVGGIGMKGSGSGSLWNWSRIVWLIKESFGLFVRLLGPLFVIIASGLISTVITIHFRVLIPFYSPYFSFPGIVNLCFSIYMTYNIGFNYFMVVFSKPGFSDEIGPSTPIEGELADPKKSQPRYCKTCKIIKPERSHHCHVCQRCVLKMDHHCPWVMN